MEIWRVIKITDKDIEDIKIYIFYSSKTEPEILSIYDKYTAKLREKNIDYEAIDITETKERAKEFDIKVTPSICLVINGELEMRYEGLVHMKEVLGESSII